jgi:hypothetical protein
VNFQPINPRFGTIRIQAGRTRWSGLCNQDTTEVRKAPWSMSSIPSADGYHPAESVVRPTRRHEEYSYPFGTANGCCTQLIPARTHHPTAIQVDQSTGNSRIFARRLTIVLWRSVSFRVVRTHSLPFPAGYIDPGTFGGSTPPEATIRVLSAFVAA